MVAFRDFKQNKYIFTRISNRLQVFITHDYCINRKRINEDVLPVDRCCILTFYIELKHMFSIDTCFTNETKKQQV